MRLEISDVAIVGGGLSGSLVAAQLLRQARTPLTVAIVERQVPIGPGLAYGTRSPSHLLNVPAAKMSALPDDEEDFLRFWRMRDPAASPSGFAQRRLYGEYVMRLLAEAEVASAGRLLRKQATVQDLSAEHGPLLLALSDGSLLAADTVVLAMGNCPPQDPARLDPSLLSQPAYQRDPWAPWVLDDLPKRAPVLLLGSGLTAVDLALSLRDRGHEGEIHALSRHGLLPQAHAPVSSVALELGRSLSVRQLLRKIREQSEGADWRAVLDSIRPQVPQLWQRLPRTERRRFLRHLRTYWEVHRHRLPPSVAQTIESMRAAGSLHVHAGRLLSLSTDGEGGRAEWIPRGGDAPRVLHFGRAINCRGPGLNLRRVRDPFLDRLWVGGWVSFDSLGLGIATAADGAVVDAANRPSDRLFAVGPLRRGELWESTAVPEIREQALRLARRLLDQPRRFASAAAP